MDAVIPLEQEYPQLAEQIKLIANRQHRLIRGFDANWRERHYHFWDGTVVDRRSPLPGRNDACPCGSKQKFKKCCGR